MGGCCFLGNFSCGFCLAIATTVPLLLATDLGSHRSTCGLVVPSLERACRQQSPDVFLFSASHL